MTISTTSDPEVNDFPRLSRFYGISFSDLCEMPRWARHLYIQSMPMIEAEEQLALMQVSDYPHVDEKSRKKIHRAVISRIEQSATSTPAAPEAPTIDLVTNPEDARKKLAGIGINVVMEPSPAKEVTADA